MTREEVMISLGLDASALKTGMTSADFIIKESMQDTFKGIKRLVGINMVEMGMKALELWDKASQKIGESIYSHIYDATDTAIGAARDKLRKLLKDTEDATNNLTKGRRGFVFKTGSDELKQSVLEAERGEINYKLAAAEKDKHFGELAIERAKQMASFGKEDAATTDKYRVEAVQAVAAAEVQILNLQAEQLKNEEEQKDLADKRAEKAAAERQKSFEAFTKEYELAYKKQQLEEKALETAIQSSLTANARLDKAKGDRLGFTIEDLAANADWAMGGRQAQDITQLRTWARENAMMGNFDRAKWQSNRADQLFEDLKKQNPFLRDPLEELKDEAKRSADALSDMVENGVQIIPSD